jgi:hypothetical protein
MFTTLPEPWKYHLEQVDYSSSAFWDHRAWPPDPIRLQSMDTWRNLRKILWEITAKLVPKEQQLTPAELFLLQATTYLYETGWQTPDALQLPLQQRYAESGFIIRNSTRLELSYLETTTRNALACIASAPGIDDLSVFPLSPEPMGQGESASIRYLAALFQLADLLFIRRLNKRTMSMLADAEMLDPLSARLLLQPYLPFIDIQPGEVTASFELHANDKYLATKMKALFADPILLWWERNASWLQERFHFSFAFHEKVKTIENEAAPDPLATACKAFIPFLEQYTPQLIISRKIPSMSVPSTTNVHEASIEGNAQTLPIRTALKRTRAFICYSSNDKKYLEELRMHLKPSHVDVWDATQIPIGARWREEISHALDTTKVAIMLVSATFLASDFIVKNELPPLLAAAEREGAVIVSIIIGRCSFQSSPLEKFQPVNPPDKPLNLMRKGERDVVWNRVAELVKGMLAPQMQ